MVNDPVNILLVDDQPAKLLSYEAILKDLGENLVKTSSANEALQFLLKHDVAVILIDVCMPDLDGYELAAMIRAHPRYQATAIIFISAIALTDLDRIKGYEYGAVDYVPVPVVPDLLRAKVRVFIELHRKTRQLEKLNAELEQRVAERTAELEQANADLERRVDERTREREMALAQVHQMQKLESLGQLTGGLAHDFNNLLMAILGNLDILRSKCLPVDPTLERFVDSAIQAAERGANLTQRMLAFARRQELRPEAVELPRVIDGMADMLRRSLGSTIEIRFDFADALPAICVDPNQFELAVLNLSLNARDAMPQGGQLTITARNETVKAGGAEGLAAGRYVCLAVVDTGMGMDEATLARAPEPFFTTKETGKGTGLGLSMVYGLAAQSGGAARITSQLKRGTTVELWLPVASKVTLASAETSAAEKSQATPTQAHRILVVDDDSLVAESTVSMLEHLGHSAILTTSCIAALEALRTEPQIDLVITDQVMPGMTGIELARRIRQLRPELPVILATGYSELVQRRNEPGFVTLDKPYHLDKLAAMISRVMLRDVEMPADGALRRA
ncbi:MAG: response regulator [Alphaproteobacteria bacterium]|nr:response regulator [Alphaproteobacteria bacterium]